MDGLPKTGAGMAQRPATCESHGAYTERGFVVGAGLPSGGRAIWLGCPQCEAKRAATRSDSVVLAEQQRQHRVERTLGLGGVPARYRGAGFDRFEASTDAQRAALARVKRYATELLGVQRQRSTLVLSGKPGTGKTHLALAVMQHLQPQVSGVYLKALDLIRTVRSAWRKGSVLSETDVIRLLADAGLLIIDEIGVQYGTESEQDTMFDILDRRYQELRPSILVTNESRSELQKVLGERIYDRLREDGIFVPFDWESHRGNP